MGKYNYLIQRHISGPDGAAANCNGKGAEWRDCGTAQHRHADEFGNTGYGDRDVARSDLAELRRMYPESTYRLIQICN